MVDSEDFERFRGFLRRPEVQYYLILAAVFLTGFMVGIMVSIQIGVIRYESPPEIPYLGIEVPDNAIPENSIGP
jgi:hypothetical protein